jgi:methyl-accepting chemotaxis protein
MHSSIKSKLIFMSLLGFAAVAFSVVLSYLIAVREINTIMRTDIEAVANSLEKSIDYIAAHNPDGYQDPDFKQFIYNVKIGKSGYVFMMNRDGVMTVHSKNEGANLAGNSHIDQIRKHKGAGVVEYTSVSTGQEKAVAYRYIKGWDMWVVPGVNKEDYFDQLKGSFLKWNLTCALLIIVFLLVASYKIIRSISVPILSAVQVADRLANGDLTVEIPAEYEAAGGEIAALNRAQRLMVKSLNSTVLRVGASSRALTSISDNISEAAQLVTSAGQEQAAAVEETSAAVLAINSSVQEVAQGVASLSMSASDTSSSTMELAASVEEVALNMEKLAGTVEEVSSSILETSAAARQIGASVQALLEITATNVASITEMDASIKQVGQYAKGTADISKEVLAEAEAGRDSVHATIAGIAEIKRASRTTSDVIHALGGSATSISAILRVIDDITEQTNLLALNAAITAAQAGEHGKGFAVVASEIKLLAERTKGSTKEIRDVITGVLEHTELAVNTIAVAERSIESGSKLSQHSGEVLDKIYSKVKKSADQVGEIARATVEQATGSQLISKNMESHSHMITQIRNATREQERGNEMIVQAVEQIKGMNLQVRNSTREQLNASREIALSTENINLTAQRINRACHEQSRFSGSILKATEGVVHGSETNTRASGALNQAVSGLVRQVKDLQDEMGSFQTAKS